MKHKVFKLVCGTADCQPIIYNGEDDCIHFWTLHTAMASEVGYEFLNNLVCNRGNFLMFCEMMNRHYKCIDDNMPSFSSVSTFESWFFSWAALLGIDFRSSADPFCGSEPECLACDGTHFGITTKMLDIRPIDAPETEETRDPTHLRYDRIFMPFHRKPNKENIVCARKKLLELCVYYISMEGERLNREDEETVLDCLLEDVYCTNYISPFLQDAFPIDLRHAAAQFLSLLLRDAPVSSVIPYREAERLLRDMHQILVDDTNFVYESLDDISPEIVTLLRHSRLTDFFATVCNFISYLCMFLLDLHSNDVPSEPAVPIPNTYNPESGTCYYFTKHGQQVRVLPKYSKNVSKSFTEQCKKDFPKPSKHNWTYLFLWFCAKHHHCYGFHIIAGAEGRKDAFASAYKYMQSAPPIVYYDFSCSLSEYALNRQPDFFRNTRFFLDEFHSFGHTCGDNHKAKRIKGIPHPNTSICEQFNSYLKGFVYTSNKLTQSHFTFLLQLFIHIWNERKTESWLFF